MEEITTPEEMSQLLRSSQALILFKYSPTCGISQVAQEAWETFSTSKTAFRLAQCDVVTARSAARATVELVGVAHQSPQILAMHRGRCLGHTSHYSITTTWLEAMKERLLALESGLG